MQLHAVVFTLMMLGPLAAVARVHCEQRWEGTAPFCEPECQDGWTLLRAVDDVTKGGAGCDPSTPEKEVECENSFGAHCWTSYKYLCERCRPI
ncbi:MAG: hypothetical protein M1817_005759 [Caeruleum heppii]|nr:MAG: hypothetical protein M1817_005759 [Caeruleum heppii]